LADEEWWEQFQDDPSFWAQGQDVVSDYDYMSPLGGYDFSDPYAGAFETGFGGGQQYFFDTQTGQIVSAEQAQQLDPTFSPNNPGFGSSGSPLGPFNNPSDPSALPGLLQRLGSWVSTNPGQAAGLGLTGLTTGVGLAGVIQKAAQGNQQAKTIISRAIAGASPQEQQAYQQALSGFQTLQNYSLGSPTSLMAQLGSRVPGEEAAFQGGLDRLNQSGQRVDQLTQALNPAYQQGLPNMLSQQSGILGAASPVLQGIAAGQMPQQISSLVEQAYQPQFGDLATNLIEQARNRGFAGGADLLTQAPSTSMGQTALRDLQGQMANSKLQTALQYYPQAVSTGAGAYSTPSALRMAGANQLEGLNQNIIQALGGIGQNGMANRMNFLNAATGAMTGQANIGNSMQWGRIGSANVTQTTSTPQTLLDSFTPLAGLLGGVGSVLSGLGRQNMSGV
jgi:hypothetical protein